METRELRKRQANGLRKLASTVVTVRLQENLRAGAGALDRLNELDTALYKFLGTSVAGILASHRMKIQEEEEHQERMRKLMEKLNPV